MESGQRSRHPQLGFETAVKPESFYVEDVSGPLLEGELDRARAWGERLAAKRAVGAG